ncbi:MAG: hypothetical protein ABI333_19190, partial [bacterium]
RRTDAFYDRVSTSASLAVTSAAHMTTARSYLGDWPCPLVLKDPQLVYTLHVWLAAALDLGRPCFVVFTLRPRGELVRAWEVAPYTAPLLRTAELGTLLRLQLVQRELCQRSHVPYATYTLDQLRSKRGEAVLCAALRGAFDPCAP